MIKRWGIQVNEEHFLICGNPRQWVKLGNLQEAYRFTNPIYAEDVSMEMKENGYHCSICPAEAIVFLA